MISFEIFQAIKNSIVLLFLTKFSIDDLRTTEIKDFEAYIFFGTCALFFILEAFVFGIEEYFLISVLIFNLTAIALYFLGQWGAGDSVILMSLGFILRFSIVYSLLNILLLFSIGIAYSFLYSLIFSILKRKNYSIYAIAPLAFLIFSVFYFFKDFIFSIILFLAFLYSSLPFMLKVQKDFVRKIPTKKLKIGDVLLSFKIWRGITKEELEKIRKEKKFVYIKEGIRYAPTFLIYFTLILLSQFYKIEVTSMQLSLEQFLQTLQNLF